MSFERFDSADRTPAPRILLIAILVALSQLGNTCGGFSDAESSCIVDDECLEDDVCVENFCVETCVDDDECVAGEVCTAVSRAEDVVRTCSFEEPENLNNFSECSVDADCQTEDPAAACSVDGFCFVPETVSALLIEDTTPVSALIEPADGAPGADLAAVLLVDPTGEPTAWGSTLAARDPLGERIVSPFDGNALPLTESCVEGPFQTSTVSLGGEGGYALIEFVGLDGRPITEPPAEWRVRIIEWSTNCDAELPESEERVRVSGCAAANYDTLDLASDCPLTFGVDISGDTILEPDAL